MSFGYLVVAWSIWLGWFSPDFFISGIVQLSFLRDIYNQIWPFGGPCLALLFSPTFWLCGRPTTGFCWWICWLCGGRLQENFIFAFVFDNLHTQLLRAGVNFVDNLFVNCTVRRFTYLQFNLPLSLILNWPCSGIILHWNFCVIYVLNFVGAASICGNIFHITRFRYSLVPKGGNSGDKERPPGEAGFCTALVVCLWPDLRSYASSKPLGDITPRISSFSESSRSKSQWTLQNYSPGSVRSANASTKKWRPIAQYAMYTGQLVCDIKRNPSSRRIKPLRTETHGRQRVASIGSNGRSGKPTTSLGVGKCL